MKKKKDLARKLPSRHLPAQAIETLEEDVKNVYEICYLYCQL